MIKNSIIGNGTVKRFSEIVAINLMLIVAAALFLPYVPSSIIVFCAGIILCLLPSVGKGLLKYKCVYFATAFFAITAGVSLYYGNYTGLRRTGIFAAMLAVGYVARSIMTRQLFRMISDILVAGGCIATAYSMVEAVINRNNPYYRCTAMYSNANHLGAVLALVIFVCFYRIMTTERKRIKALFYSAGFFCAFGIYVCKSLSLWFIIVLGAIILLLFQRRYKLLAIFLGLLSVAIVAVIIYPELVHRLDELVATTKTRGHVWQFAFDEIKKSPFFGHGFFSYDFLYKQLAQPNGYFPTTHAHNFVIDTVMNHGIVGTLLSFTAIILYMKSVISCRHKLRKNGKRSNITGLILALSVSLAIYGIIDISFIWVQTGMIVAFIYSAFGIEEDKLKELETELNAEKDKA